MTVLVLLMYSTNSDSEVHVVILPKWDFIWQEISTLLKFSSLLKLENVFVKHYAPNHMPDPKGECSLKENNSELHYRICSKVNQFIYTLVCNYMPNIRILAKAVLQIFCSQGCSYTTCLCPENRSNSSENLRNGLKNNQFIYTLVCNYMPNIRILASQYLYKMPVSEKGEYLNQKFTE